MELLTRIYDCDWTLRVDSRIRWTMKTGSSCSSQRLIVKEDGGLMFEEPDKKPVFYIKSQKRCCFFYILDFVLSLKGIINLCIYTGRLC